MQFCIWHRAMFERPEIIPSLNENPLDWMG
jgi:hypothetical protein